MSPATPTNLWHRSGAASFLAGFRAAWLSALAYVVIGTYIGIAALTHDFGFGLWWAMASTVLVWAAPAQVILVSALATGGAPLATALAVGVSSARLLPMVMSLPPLLSAGLLFLTPVSFLISTTRNCRLTSDWLALAIGIVLGPLMAAWQVGLDLLWTGVVGGSLAYGIHRLHEALK